LRAPPPVQVTVPEGNALRLVCSVTWGVAAAAVTTLGLQHLDLPPHAGSVLTAVLAAGLAWRLAPGDAGALVWDGGAWGFHGRSGRVRVMMDLDRWLLLRFDADTGPIAWLGVGAHAAGPAWHGLRAAVYWPGSHDQPA
jgi:hypothetical protein